MTDEETGTEIHCHTRTRSFIPMYEQVRKMQVYHNVI